MKKGSWYRNLVLWIVDNYLEGISIIACIGVIIGTYPLIEEESRLFGIMLLSEGIMTVFLVSWFFFCAMDIRDHLKSIVENTRKDTALNSLKERKSTTVNENSSIVREKTKKTNDDTIEIPLRICPNCGTDLGEEHGGFCPICGTNFME